MSSYRVSLDAPPQCNCGPGGCTFSASGLVSPPVPGMIKAQISNPNQMLHWKIVDPNNPHPPIADGDVQIGNPANPNEAPPWAWQIPATPVNVTQGQDYKLLLELGWIQFIDDGTIHWFVP